MLKAALIAVMGLGFGSAAQAQTLEERLAEVIDACPEAEIRFISPQTAGPYGRILGGQRYLHNPCDLETNENPILLRAMYDWQHGGTYGTSTSARNVARNTISVIRPDERYGAFRDFAEEVGRPELNPRINNNLTESRRFGPLTEIRN